MENMWSTRLRCLGWSLRAAKQSAYSIANSTIQTYNMYANRYIQFCKVREVDFSDNTNIPCIADFLCETADSSDRPESVLHTVSAALSFLFEALGRASPMVHPEIKRLITALIKTGTVRPMKRSRPMPVEAFVRYFRELGPTDELSLKDLRRKTVTLLALVFMARPSDLAPKGVVFNSKFLSVEKTVLSTNDIQFNDDGSLSVTFWGIKNDSKRQGFEVTVHPNKNDVLSDPVECLRLYIERTQEFRPKDTNPLFITLKQPYHALSSDTIGNILEEAISAAGLSYLGYSAKSFRPTAATMAVQKGMLPETAMQLGRWKTKEVFFNHYVYPKVPDTYTGNLFDVKD